MKFDFSKLFAWAVIAAASIITVFLMIFAIKIFFYLFLSVLNFFGYGN